MAQIELESNKIEGLNLEQIYAIYTEESSGKKIPLEELEMIDYNCQKVGNYEGKGIEPFIKFNKNNLYQVLESMLAQGLFPILDIKKGIAIASIGSHTNLKFLLKCYYSEFDPDEEELNHAEISDNFIKSGYGIQISREKLIIFSKRDLIKIGYGGVLSRFARKHFFTMYGI